MMNNFCVVLLIAILFCKTGLGDLQNDEKRDMNLDSEEKIRNIRGLVNTMSNENYFTPMGKNGDMRTFERSDRIFDLDAGNPDVHGSIERPCQAFDTFCIRKYFAMHSKCKISGRRLPDPFYRAVHAITYSSVNATLTLAPVDFFGMNNARVAEFYIDKVTDNLVIAITFDQVRRIANYSYVTYHWRGREPQITRGLTDLTLGIVTVTAVIPRLHDLRFDRAEISSYADTLVGPLIVGSSIFESSGPQAQFQFSVFLSQAEISHADELLTTGPFLLTAFLQYNICDFGVKIL